MRPPPASSLFPYTTLFRSLGLVPEAGYFHLKLSIIRRYASTLSTPTGEPRSTIATLPLRQRDRKSTRLNSSHANISYAVFCLKKKTSKQPQTRSSVVDQRS